MKLFVQASLDYRLASPADVLLQIEAAAIPEQRVVDPFFRLSDIGDMARVAGQDAVGERVWLTVADRLVVEYRATVEVDRIGADIAVLPRLPLPLLPAETVQYLMASRYCPSDQFQSFVDAEFSGLEGGARVMAMRDWVERHFSYEAGVSTSATTALETFVRRAGVCRDYAHMLITLVRAAGIPARIASVYALGVEPQDFHAVAEVFLNGGWHLVDATGMATPAAMAKIGVGRDAADIAFLTTYGQAELVAQTVSVAAL
jgi:transglutaminase-like putative cysteine protease